MSKRLQVILDDEQMAAVKELAKARHQTVAEFVRDALALAQQQQPRSSAAAKLQAIRVAADHSFPTGDIDQMLSEIEAGYSAR